MSTNLQCWKGQPNLWTVMATVTLSALLLATTTPAIVHASDPAGIYGIIQRVVAEPNDAAPERVQVFGLFALSERKPAPANTFSPGTYGPPAEGYLYFTCPKSFLDDCRRQWQDLKKAADQKSCVAFGDRYATDPRPNARLRDPSEPPADPDDFPRAMGVNILPIGSEGACHDVLQLKVTSAEIPTTSLPDPVSPTLAPAETAPSPDAAAPPASDPSSSLGGQSTGGSGGLGGSGSLLALGGIAVAAVLLWAARRRR